MRRVVNHLWPVLHCQPPRSPFRLCDWTAPLCVTGSPRSSANPIVHGREAAGGTR
jgi:hypothetical protein